MSKMKNCRIRGKYSSNYDEYSCLRITATFIRKGKISKKNRLDDNKVFAESKASPIPNRSRCSAIENISWVKLHFVQRRWNSLKK